MDPSLPPANRPKLTLGAILGLIALLAVLITWGVVPNRRRVERAQAAVEHANLQQLRKVVSVLEAKANRTAEDERIYQRAGRLIREYEAKTK